MEFGESYSRRIVMLITQIEKVREVGDGGDAAIERQKSNIIVGGANMRGWPEKMIDDELEIVSNAGVVQLQREISDSINIQVAKAVKRAADPIILTWEEWIPQSILSYWIQWTSCNRMKLSYIG
ncbi:hypothetical protein Bca4012_020694 [Brassica carinata]